MIFAYLSIAAHVTISGAASPRTAEKRRVMRGNPHDRNTFWHAGSLVAFIFIFVGKSHWRQKGRLHQESGSFRMAVYEGKVLRRGKLMPLDSVAGGSKPGPAPVSMRARFLAREMLVFEKKQPPKGKTP